MLRRRFWERVLAALVAVWFVVTTTDPAAVRACPMHDIPGMTHAAPEAHAASTAASTAATAATAPAGRSHHPAGHACTCLGHCCGAAPASLGVANVTALATAVLHSAIPPGRPDHEYVAAWVDFVLPFATAPPAPLPA